MEGKPRFNEGDIIYWYCDLDDRVHNATVLFVSYAKAGEACIDISYEVEDCVCGKKNSLY